MKKHVAQTSMAAFFNLDASKLTDRRRTIVECVAQNGTLCNIDISEITGLPINAVSGQVNWLVKNYYLELDRVDMSRTGNKAKFWKVSENL